MMTATGRTGRAYTCERHPLFLAMGKAAALAHLVEEHPEVLAHPSSSDDDSLAFLHIIGRTPRRPICAEPAPYTPPGPPRGWGRYPMTNTAMEASS